MTDLVLVRHGETKWNRIGRVQGLTDIPLNDTGAAQARDAGSALAGEHWDAIVSSPLSRATATAGIIADLVGLPSVEIVDALHERDYGEAEGMDAPAIAARFGGTLVARETREQVVDRVRPALLAIAGRHRGESVLVVTHGAVIGSLVRWATDWAWPTPGQAIANASAHRFRVTAGELALTEFAGRAWPQDSASSASASARLSGAPGGDALQHRQQARG